MNKKIKVFFWLIVVASVLTAIFIVQSFAVVVVGILFSYVIHGLFLSDHIYYNPRSDYQVRLSTALMLEGVLKHSQFTLPQPLSSSIDSGILSIELHCKLLGYIVDPYVEISVNDVVSRQYFERGVGGRRFLNMSLFTHELQKPGAVVAIKGTFCTLKEGSLTLSGFENASYLDKRILIISPHADDAELAAFGLYRRASSAMIVTISAGEVDAKSFQRITGSQKAAGLLKGRLRAWDSMAIPLWAGRHVQTLHLGYCCMTLQAMCERSGSPVASHATGEIDIRPYRVLNPRLLPGDKTGENTWDNLVADLVDILSEFQPEIIVTPHPIIDPQSDHKYSTQATLQACEIAQLNPQVLLYANHYRNTDMYPYGVEHSDVPLPPLFGDALLGDRLLSVALSDAEQVDKICALQMMHDLNRPLAFKKRLRRWLQRLLGRSHMPYGHDDYFRKAVRQQELFWVSSMDQIKQSSSSVNY